MRKYLAVILCAAVVPGLAFAWSEYVDEAIGELEEGLDEIGIPRGESPDPSAGLPDDSAVIPEGPGTPGSAPEGPATKVKTDSAPSGETTLIVTSSPSTAPVTVDGRDVGVTPLYCTDLSPGRHYVTVADVSDEVELKSGGVTHLDVTYAAAPEDKSGNPATAGNYVDNRDNYFELHLGNN